jgi:hypothetical protein
MERTSLVKRLCQARLTAFWWSAAILAVAGCGADNQGVTVKGQVLQNGQPIPFLPSEDLIVGFSQEVPAGQKPVGASGAVKPEDGTFTVNGPGGRGIPPGRYRISLSSQINGGNDRNRFERLFSPQKQPLIAEVGPEKGQTFRIDVGRWTVTRQ